MKNLIYGNKLKSITVAENWSELTTKQFIRITAILHSDEPTARKLDRILHALSTLSLWKFCRIPLEVRAYCFDHIEWVLQEQNVTTQLIPKYKNYYGPESEFDNLILAEFHHCEMAYYDYATNNNDDALNELVAILYRKPRLPQQSNSYTGDRRRPFNYAEIMDEKRNIAKWEKPVKLAILMWYDACRQHLVKCYPSAFAGDEPQSNFTGLYKMIRSLSGDKYGTFQQVETLNVHTAFLEIVMSLEEAEDLKSKNLI